ncbi:MAG: DEAD/DEAH box helicase family protein [Saccharofermentanales bacterium]
MSRNNLFPERPSVNPTIYAYEELSPEYKGLLKVGYTAVSVDDRVAKQHDIKHPDGKLPYRIVLREPALYPDGSSFTDHDVHRILKKKGFVHEGGEWFRCSKDDVLAAVVAVKTRTDNTENRIRSFTMRPEQEAAVSKTEEYFRSMMKSEHGRVPKFLWNAKMRFGKTFAAYQLAKRMRYKKVLVLTFKPAVEASWEEDLMTHTDFDGWQFYSRNSIKTPVELDQKRPIVCFGSFQDYMGIDRETGGIKPKNEWVHTINWDLVIFDEYHFGAWRDNAKKLFEQEDEDTYDAMDIESYKEKEADNAYNESFLPITSSSYLFLSGTPFRALNSGEFIEEQIYTWTYSDEQRAKEEWNGEGENPYLALPRMVLLTYKIPEHIQEIASRGEFNEFDINTFFSAEGHGEKAKFIYKDHVQKWLDLIRGACLETTVDELKLGAKRPPMPYSDVRLLNVLTHTLWFLPNVASCYAMANLLREKQNVFYHDYKLNICAGSGAGIGLSALGPVRDSMRDPLHSKTITLSCGKLTTGVTIRPWTGIFMLRNLSSPETYFQSAFRVQSPWTVKRENGDGEEIIKRECYIFDFALDRSLRQISDYSCRLNVSERSVERKVEEFINFLPVLAYDGSSMRAVNAAEILDITTAGTSAVLLAKRWQSALLVNVDNDTLKRIIASEEAMAAIMKIEGFRALGSNIIQIVINKSESVKKARKESEHLTSRQKDKLSKEEKEYKKKRKEIQEKLIKFATRVPIFMYLTDYRERSLRDVITQLEPELFKRVTGLEIADFEILLALGVFNATLMNEAIFKFKRYEDASLRYAGIDRHRKDEPVGLFDTVISREDYDRISEQLIEIPVFPTGD